MSEPKSTIVNKFQRMAATPTESELADSMKAITYRISDLDLTKLDFLAKELDETRQKVVYEILHEALDYALIGFANGRGYSSQQTQQLMTTGSPYGVAPTEDQEELNL